MAVILKESLTFDDVLLVPGHSAVHPKDTAVVSSLTDTIQLPMHDILRQRLMRKIESLPEEQVYQILDYIEFLESKYGDDLEAEASGLQRFAEAVEDKLRKKALSPATLRAPIAGTM